MSHDIAHEGCGKKIEFVLHIFSRTMLRNTTSPKKFRRVMKEAAMFVCKVAFKFEFELKTFSTFHNNMWYSMLEFSTILYIFTIFN
jgi:uracil phosphoribosyltransferase